MKKAILVLFAFLAILSVVYLTTSIDVYIMAFRGFSSLSKTVIRFAEIAAFVIFLLFFVVLLSTIWDRVRKLKKNEKGD